MQRRPVLGGVDDLPGEHRVALGLDARLAGQGEELVEHRVVDALLGIVEQQVAEDDVIAVEPLGIGSEHRPAGS